MNEPRSALKAHRPNDVLTTPHGAREGTTSRRATLVTAAPNVERLGQLRRASWRPCRACGSTHVTRRPPSLLEQKQEVLCLRLLPLLGAERRPPVIHRNSGDPISCCTLFNAGSVALDSHVVALRWIHMLYQCSFCTQNKAPWGRWTHGRQCQPMSPNACTAGLVHSWPSCRYVRGRPSGELP